jgi:hypothetical protein
MHLIKKTYKGGITMKKKIMIIMTGLLLISLNVFADDVSMTVTAM